MQSTIDWAGVNSSMKNGKPDSLNVDSKQLGDKSYNAFAPKDLDKIDETWTVQLVVPKSKVLETYNQILVFTAVAAILIIILIVVVIQMKLAQ